MTDRSLCDWTPRHRYHDSALHCLNQRYSLVHRLAPACYAPALLTTGSSLLEIGKLPEVMDDIQVPVAKVSTNTPRLELD